jgi:hypothetical protein
MAFRRSRRSIAGAALLLGVPCVTVVCCSARVASAARQQDREGESRPNIVPIMADDVGSEVLGCYGGTSYKTRRIDSLADTGTRFNHCFSICEHKGKRWVRNHRWKLYDDGRLIDAQNDPPENSPSEPEDESRQAALAREILETAFESLDPAPAVGFLIKPGEVVLTVSGKPVATYVYSDEQIRRPYFAHVKSPGGIQVTRNHPPIAGKDSKDHATMHPGIWMAFGDLDGEDFWRNKGRVVHEAFVTEPTGGPGKGAFVVRNRYERASGELVCREQCRVTLLVRPEGYLLLWDSTFAADREFYFGDQEEMGLAFRVTTPITVDNGGTMRDSQGRKNGDGIWGKTAQWCDYSGTVDGRKIGMTVMCHPENFRSSWMHARDYGFIAANPFGRNAFTKAQPSKVVVTLGKRLRLRYGVLTHDGPPDAPTDLEAAYQDYLTLSRAD